MLLTRLTECHYIGNNNIVICNQIPRLKVQSRTPTSNTKPFVAKWSTDAHAHKKLRESERGNEWRKESANAVKRREKTKKKKTRQ